MKAGVPALLAAQRRNNEGGKDLASIDDGGRRMAARGSAIAVEGIGLPKAHGVCQREGHDHGRRCASPWDKGNAKCGKGP